MTAACAWIKGKRNMDGTSTQEEGHEAYIY